MPDNNLDEYRNLLIQADQKAQDDYDKTVIALSSGALGVSFAFIKDIVGSSNWKDPNLLLFSWICWGTSVTLVLISYYFSQQALRRAITQIDAKVIRKERVGGLFSIITSICNALQGLLFIVGVILIVIFVSSNLR
jgi:hypothetical protein